MPMEGIIEGLFSSLVRALVWLFVEVVVDILIKGLGYLLCRPFKRVDPEGLSALSVGILGWIFITATIFFVYETISASFAIDSCLDAGGSFDYQSESCDYE